jgi:23S rRNA (cytosine1962-C5)-methyltransferase
MQILSDKPLFFLINSYTTGISSIVLENILKTTMLKKYPNGIVSAGEVGLPITRDNLILPCGIYGKWEENA